MRPTLAAHVRARRYVSDGEARVVLHDERSGRMAEIDERTWTLIEAADGTRDLEGVALAASRAGAHANVELVTEMFEELDAAGFLASDDEAEPERASANAEARPLDVLSDYRFACDGRGSCCRLYATVLFSPVEAARARALAPEVLDGGERHERVFLPIAGSAPTAAGAVALVDGRCAYLDEEDHCRVHARGGADAKPVGCKSFPARFVDDGEVVRVSVAVECACVLESLRAQGGAPLVPPSLVTRADLAPAIFVRALSDEVLVADGARVSRAEFLAWSRAVALPEGDAIGWLVALGDALARGEIVTTITPAPLDADRLVPHLEALAARAERHLERNAAWRSERDLSRRATSWIAAAASVLLDAEARATIAERAQDPRAEAFYLRAIWHAHEMAAERPLAEAALDRATRILVARALPAAVALIGDEPDPAARHPLALVEAILRAHALDEYADDVREPALRSRA